MRKTLSKIESSWFRRFIRKHEKYIPILFFIGGFIFDSLTLGRIDRLYDLVVLSLYMVVLTVTVYLYNLVDDGRWKGTFLERYEDYFPLAIQFFFGGLSSAYVVYFSRSVSLSKTLSFFIILVVLLLANELLKKRISNKYLQFSIYFFVSFTFFIFMIPVFVREMNDQIFTFSGLVSLVCTLGLIALTYWASPSTREEIRIGQLLAVIFFLYFSINTFYFLRLIPPVPLALATGMVAHDVQVENNRYIVTYETDQWYVFWRAHRLQYIHRPEESVYIFSSIFAPTALEKSIFHRWKWYDSNTGEWEVIEDIGYDITGGRDNGYRGYTYKKNVKQGLWKVEVITEEELVLGVIDFEIIMDSSLQPQRVVKRAF